MNREHKVHGKTRVWTLGLLRSVLVGVVEKTLALVSSETLEVGEPLQGWFLSLHVLLYIALSVEDWLIQFAFSGPSCGEGESFLSVSPMESAAPTCNRNSRGQFHDSFFEFFKTLMYYYLCWGEHEHMVRYACK